MTNDKLTNKFHDEFEHFEFEVPADAWNNVESRLDNQSDKKRVWPLFSISGIAASFLIYLGVNIVSNLSPSAEDLGTTSNTTINSNEQLTTVNIDPLKSTINPVDKKIKLKPLDDFQTIFGSSSDEITKRFEISIDARKSNLYYSDLHFKPIKEESSEKDIKRKVKVNLSDLNLHTGSSITNNKRFEMSDYAPNSSTDPTQSSSGGIYAASSFSEPEAAYDFTQGNEFGLSANLPIGEKLSLYSGLTYSYNQTIISGHSNMTLSREDRYKFKHIGLPIGINYSLVKSRKLEAFIGTAVSIEKTLNIKHEHTGFGNDPSYTESIDSPGFQNGIHVETGVKVGLSRKVNLLFKGKLSNYTILSADHPINIRNNSFILPQAHIGLNFVLVK